jgi:hypothetical protein
MWSAPTSYCSSCVPRTRWRARVLVVGSRHYLGFALPEKSLGMALPAECLSDGVVPHDKRRHRLLETGLVADMAGPVFVGRRQPHELATFFLIRSYEPLR